MSDASTTFNSGHPRSSVRSAARTREAATVVGPGQTATIVGIDNLQDRLELIVSNDSASGNVLVQNAAGATFGTVYPGTGWTRPISNTVKIVNNGTVVCNVGEVYPE